MHQYYLIDRTETEVPFINVMLITGEGVFSLNVKPFTKDLDIETMDLVCLVEGSLRLRPGRLPEE
jgi:hypothetical protein